MESTAAPRHNGENPLSCSAQVASPVPTSNETTEAKGPVKATDSVSKKSESTVDIARDTKDAKDTAKAQSEDDTTSKSEPVEDKKAKISVSENDSNNNSEYSTKSSPAKEDYSKSQSPQSDAKNAASPGRSVTAGEQKPVEPKTHLEPKESNTTESSEVITFINRVSYSWFVDCATLIQCSGMRRRPSGKICLWKMKKAHHAIAKL